MTESSFDLVIFSEIIENKDYFSNSSAKEKENKKGFIKNCLFYKSQFNSQILLIKQANLTIKPRQNTENLIKINRNICFSSIEGYLSLLIDTLSHKVKAEKMNFCKNSFLNRIFKWESKENKENHRDFNENISNFYYFHVMNSINIDEYNDVHINNILSFSCLYDCLFLLLHRYNTKENQLNNNIFLEKHLSQILSYCIRIFDSSETYIETNKSDSIEAKNKDYNMYLIEETIVECLKIVNLISLVNNSFVSAFQVRINQIYERIALKQSGLIYLEILQFYINNNSLILIDLNNHLSKFFRLKLILNYRYEALSYSTLEFLYKNKEILSEQTDVFTLFFPIILKIFSTFPKFLLEKYFILLEFMVKSNIIKELYNYILDLPVIMLILENFDCFFNVFNSNSSRIEIEKFFNEEYSKVVKFLLRDESYKDFITVDTSNSTDSISNSIVEEVPSIEIYNKHILLLFDNLIFTTRVLSTTNIIPKLINKLFDFILQSKDFALVLKSINLIFERFSFFNEKSIAYIKEIKQLQLKKLEQLIGKWRRNYKEMINTILTEINSNFSNTVKKDLICLLCWTLGEYVVYDDFFNSEQGLNINDIQNIFESLENIVNKFIDDNQNGGNSLKNDDFNNISTVDVERMTISKTISFYNNFFKESISEEQVVNERLIEIIITSLCKLSIKFKIFLSRTVNFYNEKYFVIKNQNLLSKIREMSSCLAHVSVSNDYVKVESWF